jgi:hypothetical protein
MGDDYRAANWVWFAIGFAIVVAVAVALARRERIRSRSDRWLVVAAALAFPPVVGELVMGNVHLLLLGLLTGAWLAIRRGGRSANAVAGALVGIAVLIKIFPAIVILWFILRRRWSAVIAAAITVAALSVATVPIVGIQPWLDYPSVLLNLGPPVDAHDALAPSVWLAALFPSVIARVLVTLAILAIVSWTAVTRSEVVGFAVAVACSVLVAPALYHHYLAVLVLPILVALRWTKPRAWVAAAYLLMFGGEQAALGDAQWIVNRLMPTLGALALVAGLVAFGAVREPDRAPSPDPTGS